MPNGHRSSLNVFRTSSHLTYAYIVKLKRERLAIEIEVEAWVAAVMAAQPASLMAVVDRERRLWGPLQPRRRSQHRVSLCST